MKVALDCILGDFRAPCPLLQIGTGLFGRIQHRWLVALAQLPDLDALTGKLRLLEPAENGNHGLHVAVGIAALAIAMWFPIAIETVALYWQFVDLVWIVIFAVVYLGAFR